MNIGKASVESMNNVRESVKAYMSWMNGTDDYEANWLIYKENKELAKFYEKFLTQCVIEDIRQLKNEVEE